MAVLNSTCVCTSSVSSCAAELWGVDSLFAAHLSSPGSPVYSVVTVAPLVLL